jgi:26S proteasome regulatory subunit N2
LGVVHAGHITEAMHLLEPYFPSDPMEAGNEVSPTGGYAEGGSLYALGLIHGSQAGSAAVNRAETNIFLRKHLRASHANEVIGHGAALGVGLTAMGSANRDVCRELKQLLDTDSAVAGEAAGMAIGMILVGTGAGNTVNSILAAEKDELARVVTDLKTYARETQHEKIIRGISMGLALIQFGQEENADAVIQEMLSDRDSIMRYGAQYAIAMAYCGTGSTKAIRILLHTAVSDVSDDVRMAAVIGLAFVLFKTPERVPQLVKLLLESFNPHVRYASCMAVGIAMAGSGDAESIAMLEPMLEDMTDYVRQGALMGTAMIYMQQSDTCNGRRVRSFRERLAMIVTEKHQSTLTKMGAIMATGIMDAGGRNCSLSLGSRFGFTKMSSAVGLALWLQHWHWFPMMHMFSLALTPTLTIGLNKDFKFPKGFEIQCNAKASSFAYPRKLEEKKEEKKKRVETVTLSTTAKEKARLARKRAKAGLDTSMEVVVESKEDDKKTAGVEGMDVDACDDKPEEEEEADKKLKKKREPEPTTFRVSNPARITKSQSLVCAFDLNQRYRPIRPDEKPVGVIMLSDSTPETEDEELGTVKSPSDDPIGELAPPEPFLWTPPSALP